LYEQTNEFKTNAQENDVFLKNVLLIFGNIHHQLERY